MKRHWILRGLKVLLFVALAATVFSFVVMLLWNRLMPAIFLVLSKILFGGFRGRPGFAMHWRQRMLERWEQMTPEEREKFRAGMHGGCGPFGSSVAAPKA
jgi:hypothetical protein